MKILFLPKYSPLGPSSRYRTFQYIPLLEENGIQCTVEPLLRNHYILGIYANNISKTDVLFSYIRRLVILFKLHKFDMVYMEKEAFPYFPFAVEIILRYAKISYIVDYDDAIFHNYDLHKSGCVRLYFKNRIADVIKNARHVVTGSPYLTDYALKQNQNVLEIPTSIDLRRYEKLFNPLHKQKFIIVWIGSKSTSKYLVEIAPALKKFVDVNPSIEIKLIGFDNNMLRLIEYLPVKLIEWDSATEVLEISSSSVGIMPLTDGPSERGKCGFKLIQYMACALPTISTPLEANVKINRNSDNLFAVTHNDWFEKLTEIYLKQDYYNKVGLKNRTIVEEYYSIQSNVKYYLTLFKKTIEEKKTAS